MTWMKRFYLPVLLMLAALSVAVAAPPRPVPEMTLTSLQSAAVSGKDLAASSRWLLVYLSGDERVDGRVIEALGAFSGSLEAERVTVAVAGLPVQGLQELVARHPPLADLNWLTDADRSAAKALQLSGSPAVLGGNGDNIEWVATGAASDPKELESLMKDWVRQ